MKKAILGLIFVLTASACIIGSPMILGVSYDDLFPIDNYKIGMVLFLAVAYSYFFIFTYKKEAPKSKDVYIPKEELSKHFVGIGSTNEGLTKKVTSEIKNNEHMIIVGTTGNNKSLGLTPLLILEQLLVSNEDEIEIIFDNEQEQITFNNIKSRFDDYIEAYLAVHAYFGIDAREKGFRSSEFSREGAKYILNREQNAPNDKKVINLISKKNVEKENKEEVVLLLKKTYWSTIDEIKESVMFATIHDCMVDVFELDEVDEKQVKEVFTVLPYDIFLDGVKYGFNDSVVRDDIYKYLEENEGSLKRDLEI